MLGLGVLLAIYHALADGQIRCYANPCHWDLKNQLQVWDCSGWTTIGINSFDRYPRSHDTIAFGAPSLITTQDGHLFASWWCTYMSLTHCRWAKLAVAE